MYPNPAASREISTLSLHDALPISARCVWGSRRLLDLVALVGTGGLGKSRHQEISRDPPDAGRARVHSCRLGLKNRRRSEEHTSELQSRPHLVCRLLLEKKKNHQLHPILALLLIPTLASNSLKLNK